MEFLIIQDTRMKATIQTSEYLGLILLLLLKGLVSESLEEKLRVKELAKTTELMRKNAKNSCRKNLPWRFSKYEY